MTPGQTGYFVKYTCGGQILNRAVGVAGDHVIQVPLEGLAIDLALGNAGCQKLVYHALAVTSGQG